MQINVDRSGGLPLYRQIVEQIRSKILSGQLPPGFRLPPERRLAEALGVTRTTIINAYDELKSEGLADARVGRGTIVMPPSRVYAETPDVPRMEWSHYLNSEGLRHPDPLVRNLLEIATQASVISLAVGLPSPDLIPVELIRHLTIRILDEAGPQALLQTPTEGHYPLREAVSMWLASRGMVCSADEVIILSGSQQGLRLAARIFLNPGDAVIVEAPTYFGAKEAFRRTGVRVIAVPVDADGMQVEILAGLLRHHRPRLIYTLPTFQNPSGAVLSLERRHRLLALARNYGIPVLEDDTYTELRYDGEPLPSLKALDTAGLVLGLGTFSKILFPGLRIGWLAAPKPVIRHVALTKQTEDLHAGTLGQWVMERMLREGHLAAHLDRLRIAYRQRRDLMDAALRRHQMEGLHWEKPLGGFYFWCELPRGTDRGRLASAADDASVSFLPGHACFVDEPASSYARLNFSFTPAGKIEEGVARFMTAVHSAMSSENPMRRRAHASTHPLV